MLIKNQSRFAPFACAALALSAITFAHPVQAATWNAANDFSTSNNPNGVWSYAGSTAGVFTFENSEFGLDAWHSGPGSLPWVAHNGSGSTDNFLTVSVPANGITLHPGPSGEMSEVIFTAPSTGLYQVNASFFGEDFVGPTSTDVHVNVNGVTSLFNGFVNSFGSGPSYSAPSLALTAGDQLRFTVGFGPNQNYFFDSTGFNAVISSAGSVVPEPSAYAAFGVGFVLLGACFYRRRQATA